MEAAYVPVGFPVFNILTGNFSPIANSSKIEVFSPPLPSTSTAVNNPLHIGDTKMILKAICDLSSKMDKLIAYIRKLIHEYKGQVQRQHKHFKFLITIENIRRGAYS